ncbi:radical SAM family heme chaperone HemW [Rhodohalobacter sp. 8-1]|uniref:radical SAM family heme chaperone HemW n=1 Tax=Rhodohalobacter sp. 8-1 TaxID=3131972 RepID=UPI0030EB7AA6
MAGIYIHIPFCKQACSYCNFYFLTRKELVEPFVDALIEEILSYRSHPFSEQIIKTIYVGGGTPSLLNHQQLKQIFDALRDVFDIDAEEVTLEMNPDDVSVEYLNGLQDLGVNRASMGVQSFDPALLLFMHRAHDPSEAEQALEMLRTANFPSFTADLIYGNPGQSLDQLDRDIDRLLSYNPSHVSAYSLTVEEGTRLGKQVELGRIDVPDDDIVAEHFDLVEKKLLKKGIKRYEVSNFAMPGKEAIHNSNYWRHVNYLGLGPSAHSLFWADNGACRWSNKKDIKLYLSKDWDQLIDEETTLDLVDLAEERLMLGLRTVEGISPGEMKSLYGYELTEKQLEWLIGQQKEGFILLDEDHIRLSAKGLKIADYLILDLISKR